MVQRCRNNQPLIRYKKIQRPCLILFFLSKRKPSNRKGKVHVVQTMTRHHEHTQMHILASLFLHGCVCVCVLSDGRTVALSVCLKEDFLSFSSRGVIPEKDLPSLVGRTSCDWELPVTDTHAHTHTSTNTIWRMHQCPDVRLCLIYVHPVVSLLTSPN